MNPSALRKTGLVLAGVVMGLLGLAVGFWFYLQAARVEEARSAIGDRLQISRDAIADVEYVEEDAIRAVLDDVTLFDEAGDTILAAPRLALTLDVPSLDGDGAIEFYDVDLIEPVARLIQTPGGEWNFARAMGMTAGGEPVETQEGRPLAFRGVSIEDGRVLLAIPQEAPPPADTRFALNLPRTTIGGVPYQVYSISDVQAELPEVVVGGATGWRAEVDALSAEVAEPNIRVTELVGVFEQEGDDGVAFDVDALRFGESRLAGAGSVTFTEGGILYDAQVEADALVFDDLRPLLPNLDAEGVASFSLALESLTEERVRLAFTGLDVTSDESTVRGALAIATGGEAGLALLDADLVLDPLRLSTLASLGLVEDLPVLGQLAGRVTTEGAADGFATVDLTATLVPASDPDATPSTLLATGSLAVGDPDSPIRFDGLAVTAQPLYLATLRGFAPEQAEQLRGVVTGSVLLGGTPQDLRIAGGELAYEVDGSPTTRLSGITARVLTTPELSYELTANADPLALATLTTLFPALPVQPALLTGPIEIRGTAEAADVRANLTGTAGGIRFAGNLSFGEPFAFDLEGSVRAFSAGMLLTPDVPVEGPLTGTFAVDGTAERFSFDVDLEQVEGSFDLAGTVDLTSDPPIFDVAGNVVDFRLGALLGSPQLFPDPMSGALSLQGGAGQPYTFDVDLAGELGRLDLAGFFEPGDIPTYSASGRIAGLDLSQLPIGAIDLPPTSLTGTIDVAGTGLDPETIEGDFAFDVTQSTVSDLELSAALGQVSIRQGIAFVDTLDVQLDDTRLTAEGQWGLQRPAPAPLSYTFVSPDLSVLTRVIAPNQLVPPELAGSLRAEGEIGGSIEYPEVTTQLVGSNLRYEDWRASDIQLTLDAERGPAVGWAGQLTLVGEDLVLPQVETFQSVRMEASGNESSIAVGMYARRDAASDIALSGLLELEGMLPRGIGLQTMNLRLESAEWTLLQPARIRYTQSEGLLVENLALQRVGEEQGTVAIDGTIPPDGVANLSIQTTNFDLADLQRISPLAPDIGGTVTVQAQLTGPVSDPELLIDGLFENITYEGVETELVTLDATYSDQQLVGSAEAIIGEQRLFSADMSIPMNLSLEGMVPSFELLSTQPVTATIMADSVPMALVTAAVPGLNEGSGVGRAQVQVGGTLEAPTLSGWARLENGAFSSEATNTRYTGVRADLALSGNRVTINELAASSGGTARATGTIDFVQGSDPRLAIEATFAEFQFMEDPAVAEVTASGQLAVRGALSDPVLTGQVRLSESTFQVPELGAAEAGLDLAYTDVAQLAPIPQEGLAVVPPILGNLMVDGVQVTVDESVWLESEELRVQITGDVVLYRTGDELRVFGALQAARGTYALELSGIVREFDVISGRVQFFGTGDLNPSLDILAGYRVRSSTVGRGGDITVLVQVSGTLLSPRLQLSADTPVPLSEADLISYLIFGQPSFELGGVNRAFAEQILVQEVVGGLLASELERPILRAGLCDWVRVRPGVTQSFRSLVGGGPLEGAVIECGWELASDFFLTGQTSIGGLFGGDFNDWRLGVEWQIDDEWMWEASYGSVQRDPVFGIFDPSRSTQFSTDIRRQWEYGLPSRRSQLDMVPADALPGNEGPPLPPTPSPLDVGDDGQ